MGGIVLPLSFSCAPRLPERIPTVRGLQLPASPLSPFHAFAAWNVNPLRQLPPSRTKTRPYTGQVYNFEREFQER
jgi:hypothetical protein